MDMELWNTAQYTCVPVVWNRDPLRNQKISLTLPDDPCHRTGPGNVDLYVTDLTKQKKQL